MTDDEWNKMAKGVANAVDPHVKDCAVVIIVIEKLAEGGVARVIRKGISRDDAASACVHVSLDLPEWPEPAEEYHPEKRH